MKMNKGAIFASMAIIVVASVFAGAGTMAYFSETGSAGITFTAGDPDLKLSKTGSAPWGDSLTFTSPVWAPGDTYSIDVYVKNTGNIGLWALYVSGDNLAGSTSLAHKINITDVAYQDTVGMVHPAGGTYYDGIFGDDTSPLTLYELAYGVDNNEYMAFCWGDCATQGDYLPVGVARRFYIEFAFDSSAGNALQGATVSFDLMFEGSDDPFTPVWIP